jgi:hypothetical protein
VSFAALIAPTKPRNITYPPDLPKYAAAALILLSGCLGYSSAAANAAVHVQGGKSQACAFACESREHGKKALKRENPGKRSERCPG